ncbi:MAG: hypothetical protein BIFFINMI_00999 [Phycisphaerae bacterium]|nr:hypothetical protein [Phycisphaerae bacterium]
MTPDRLLVLGEFALLLGPALAVAWMRPAPRCGRNDRLLPDAPLIDRTLGAILDAGRRSWGVEGCAVHTRRGFTLIEVLTVVAIITVLLSIILPTAGQAREAARRSGCGRNLHFIGIALADYAARHNGFLPPVGSTQTQRSRNYFVGPLPAVEAWSAVAADEHFSGAGMLYCPSMTSASFQYDTPANPWPGEPGRTCYSRRALPVSGNGLTHLSTVSGGTAMAADLIVSPTHVQYQHATGVNVLYSDGGVDYRTDVLDLFTASGFSGGSSASNAQIDAVWAGLDR